MRTVLWDRVKGLQDTVTGLPIPFIGRTPGRTNADEADEVEQAARLLEERQVEQEDIEQPLLESTAPALVEVEVEVTASPEMDSPTKPDRGSSIPASIFNLSNTIIGAGIMALPLSIAKAGVVLGPLLILFVAVLSSITIDILARASERTGKWTFGELIDIYLGRAGSQTLRFFIFINNGGLLITYTVMFGDVLVGKAPDYNGALTNLTGIHSGEEWFLDRRFVVAVVVVVFLLPLTLRRSLTSLAWAGAVSALLAAGFCALAALLAVQAGLKGHVSLDGVSLLPNPRLNGPGWLNQALGVVSTLPVTALAFVCHYNVHPLLRELRDYSRRRWGAVLHWSMAFCTVVYIVIGAGLYLVFQDDTKSDVLLNFSAGSLGPLIGARVANALTYVVWLGFAFNLIVTYPMINWGLREVICETIWGAPEVSSTPWAAITMCILVIAYGIAMVVPDIWPVMTITGATAAVAIGWIYPALILAKWEGPGAWARKLGAAFIICLGLVTAVVALEGVLEPWVTSIWG